MNSAEMRLYVRKFWWVGLILLGIVISLVFFVVQSRRDAGANLNVLVVPGDATIVVEGKEYKPGKIHVEPGVREITASSDGFASLTQRITVTEKLTPLVFALTPESEEAREWAKENNKLYLEAEAAGGVAAQQQAQAAEERYPILSHLPYNGSFYKINYAVEDKQKNTIYIRIDATSAMGRQVALDQIKEWGYEPADYKIIFPGHANPLDQTTPELFHE
jgi:hypothetical protein